MLTKCLDGCIYNLYGPLLNSILKRHTTFNSYHFNHTLVSLEAANLLMNKNNLNYIHLGIQSSAKKMVFTTLQQFNFNSLLLCSQTMNLFSVINLTTSRASTDDEKNCDSQNICTDSIKCNFRIIQVLYFLNCGLFITSSHRFPHFLRSRPFQRPHIFCRAFFLV